MLHARAMHARHLVQTGHGSARRLRATDCLMTRRLARIAILIDKILLSRDSARP